MKLFTRQLAVLALALPVQAAFALEAHVSKEVAVAPESVWAAIGDFCGIANWHPAIATCEYSDEAGKQLRKLMLQDGAQILEQQTARKENQYSYSYTIVNGPLPVSGYQSTLKVSPTGHGSTIEWMGTFDAAGAPDEEVVKLITSIYQAGVDGIAVKAAE